VCGDAWACRTDADATLVILADGLGHGPLAAAAANRAVTTFTRSDAAQPAAILTELDRALAGTRGAAVSVLRIATRTGRATFAGIGNVAGWFDDGARRRPMVSFPGIIGQKQAKKIRELEYEVPSGGLVVLHSDGLTDKWSLADYPTLRRHDPLVIAGCLLRDAGIRRDDASVVVTRAP
jgi:serine phosphatase RsbU (regulator of sigma subunit)